MTDRERVLSFIECFEGAKETFLYGCCYWFAKILELRFGGRMMYLAVENHFVQEIGSRLYDVSGDVTDEYAASRIMPWDMVRDWDSRLHERIVRDCIEKRPVEYHI